MRHLLSFILLFFIPYAVFGGPGPLKYYDPVTARDVRSGLIGGSDGSLETTTGTDFVVRQGMGGNVIFEMNRDGSKVESFRLTDKDPSEEFDFFIYYYDGVKSMINLFAPSEVHIESNLIGLSSNHTLNIVLNDGDVGDPDSLRIWEGSNGYYIANYDADSEAFSIGGKAGSDFKVPNLYAFALNQILLESNSHSLTLDSAGILMEESNGNSMQLDGDGIHLGGIVSIPNNNDTPDCEDGIACIYSDSTTGKLTVKHGEEGTPISLEAENGEDAFRTFSLSGTATTTITVFSWNMGTDEEDQDFDAGALFTTCEVVGGETGGTDQPGIYHLVGSVRVFNSDSDPPIIYGITGTFKDDSGAAYDCYYQAVNGYLNVRCIGFNQYQGWCRGKAVPNGTH